MRPSRLWRAMTPLITAGALALAVVGCSSSGDDAKASASATPGQVSGTLRLGYFPNLTHAPALYGVEKGIFAKELGTGVTLKTSTFNSGVQEAEAVLSGALDAGYIGPNPAVNSFIKSNGEAVRIVSGATSGGAALVVRPDITSVAQLKGTTLATPSLGNTQDVALRYYLKKNGLKTDTQGGGDVSIKPQDNSVTVDAFTNKAIDGAWVPEPTASRLVAAGGKVLVNEADEWPETKGQFVTTVLLVRTAYLKKNPEIVRRLVSANVASINGLNADRDAGATVTNTALGKLAGKPLSDKVLTSAWKSLTFTPDPIAASLLTSAKHQEELGLIKNPKLDGIFDLTILNDILAKQGKPTVSDS
ncbi:ABC-type nitrate/sulfonate/bicarbonate transport system, periplasmic component [Frankia torreyi]|uniref:ABC-type nitrate/sulfonate/bicarbonate transport system, periplasmic component n=1 Tax=Frankia torreyi TaxID=1856 RepID=A0A0D8BKV7_9ACTN|nr:MULTISPECIES: ABC transporter substrate-binding protein [Frankia]KJE24720.1 ABC-type nitrate/sulfonate/bicarbonate transport system, periplasmic component [Frankia torreyi]KQC36082.1 sulfonate ABC transporter substrate-binding protein [Frankia sp. ACN1ag]KQM07575.1 ABC-type nitrate/sulfonate/bicarbonate transport system, periplasmic component [Frankia sp. CpI1-P]